MTDRILIQCSTNEQAKEFFKWFKKYGFDNLIANSKEDFNCISADETPGATSDESAYYLELE